MGTVNGFRLAFPAFASVQNYPDSVVQMQLDLSLLRMNAERWGNLLDYGSYLFTAHHLSIRRSEALAAAAGGAPGQGGGLLTSKSVDGVSMSYDVSTTANEGAGYWNQTSFGREFWQLARTMGIGPLQSGMPSANDMTSTAAWPGPYPSGSW